MRARMGPRFLIGVSDPSVNQMEYGFHVQSFGISVT